MTAEAERARLLARMKLVPLALLLSMVAALASLHFAPPAAWVGYAAAFAEAAIVGALADWFAVTALFRHPLGIPVPHTAIIPRRKDELAESLGSFVDDHFLSAESLGRHLRELDVAAAVASWMLRHRDDLADAGVRLARWVLDSLADSDYRRFLHDRLLNRMDGRDLAPIVGRLLQLAVENRHHQDVLTEILRSASATLAENKDQIRERIGQDSPWWLPGFIDDRIFEQLVTRIQTQLLAMVIDSEHELRRELDARLHALAQRLREDPSTIERFAEANARLARDPTMQAYLTELLGAIGALLRRDLDTPGGSIHRAIRAAAGRLAVGTIRDDALRERIDRWLKGGILYVVATQGAPLTAVITRTVREWDGVETARRIELQVGKDLQYIRINGTLVGGLIGLLLHALGLVP